MRVELVCELHFKQDTAFGESESNERQNSMSGIANPGPSADAALRIDFIITELFIGGAERCLTELAIGLAKRGDHVRVASVGSLPRGQQAALVDRLGAAGIEVFSAHCDRPLQFLRGRAALRDWMQRDRPDLVQTMLFHANVLGTLAAAAAGVTLRVGGVRVAERSRLRSMLEAWAMKRMDAVVCVSDSVREFVNAVHQTKATLHVIGNSVDLQQVDTTQEVDWSQVEWAEGPVGDQVLLFVGRLHTQKGIDILFNALPDLLDRYPDMQVVIVGDGPLRGWVVRRAQEMGRKRVAVMGWRGDAHSLIKGCRLLVLPSRYEGMPNVVMEAMAASKPIAATRVEGVNELLREGASDQTCPPNDVGALSRLVDQLWRDPQRAMLIGQRNREIIAAHHSSEAMVELYRDLYRSLIDQRSAG